MKTSFAALIAVTLAAPALASPAMSAPVALNKNDHITESLVAAQVGDTIRKTCPSISARYLVVWEKATALEAYARAQGYQEDEVKAFLKDRTEKARIHDLAVEYLTQAGAVAGDVESYCSAGRTEIAKGTLAGQLLRSSQ